jgi:hypothetical protein
MMCTKDYLIWDEDGGLSGFLNQPTQNEGVPQFVSQGSAKSLASGNSQNPTFLWLADMDGSVALLPRLTHLTKESINLLMLSIILVIVRMIMSTSTKTMVPYLCHITEETATLASVLIDIGNCEKRIPFSNRFEM